jgi:hypothetical protein
MVPSRKHVIDPVVPLTEKARQGSRLCGYCTSPAVPAVWACTLLTLLPYCFFSNRIPSLLHASRTNKAGCVAETDPAQGIAYVPAAPFADAPFPRALFVLTSQSNQTPSSATYSLTAPLLQLPPHAVAYHLDYVQASIEQPHRRRSWPHTERRIQTTISREFICSRRTNSELCDVALVRCYKTKWCREVRPSPSWVI